jgi:hypothetical protein
MRFPTLPEAMDILNRVTHDGCALWRIVDGKVVTPPDFKNVNGQMFYRQRLLRAGEACIIAAFYLTEDERKAAEAEARRKQCQNSPDPAVHDLYRTDCFVDKHKVQEVKVKADHFMYRFNILNLGPSSSLDEPLQTKEVTFLNYAWGCRNCDFTLRGAAPVAEKYNQVLDGPRTLDQAVAILNKNAHRGSKVWKTSAAGLVTDQGHLVKKGNVAAWLTDIEALATASYYYLHK